MEREGRNGFHSRLVPITGRVAVLSISTNLGKGYAESPKSGEDLETLPYPPRLLPKQEQNKVTVRIRNQDNG